MLVSRRTFVGLCLVAVAITGCRTAVENDSVASITISPATITVEPADTGLLMATAFDADGAVTPARIRWTSSDSTIVRVTDAGAYRAMRAGTAAVTATAGRRSASASIASAYPALQGAREYAHRGFASLFPENTLVAVRGAFDRGADGVEVDVQLTSDHRAVIMHDPTVDRTTNGTGHVDSLTFAQLRQLDACGKRPGPWGTCLVPTPTEILGAVHGRGWAILDLKGDWPSADLSALLASVTDAGLRDSVMVTSFSLDLLETVRRLDPRVVIGFLQPDIGDPTRLLRIGNSVSLVDQVALLRRQAELPDYVTRVQAGGSLVGTFTLASSNDIATLRALGVRWYISDVPLDKATLAVKRRIGQ